MRKILILLLALGASPAWAVKADVLEYRVREAGSAPYDSRFLVTPDWLRLDHGGSGDGYLLFDRHSGVIHDVSDEDRTILDIDPPRGQRHRPEGLAFTLRPVADAHAPRIMGVTPQHYLLEVGGEECQEIVVLPGAMKQALDAWRAFAARLADQQAVALPSMPAGSQSECDLLTHVYAPARGLKLGLPVYWRMPGKQRALQNYRHAQRVDDALFTLPQGYRRLKLPAGS